MSDEDYLEWLRRTVFLAGPGPDTRAEERLAEFNFWLADHEAEVRADAAQQIEATLEREGFPSRVRSVVRTIGREFLLDSPNSRGMT